MHENDAFLNDSVQGVQNGCRNCYRNSLSRAIPFLSRKVANGRRIPFHSRYWEPHTPRQYLVCIGSGPPCLCPLSRTRDRIDHMLRSLMHTMVLSSRLLYFLVRGITRTIISAYSISTKDDQLAVRAVFAVGTPTFSACAFKLFGFVLSSLIWIFFVRYRFWRKDLSANIREY